MMQFYKKRDFGELISDTFNFLKLYGKNYFKNYLLINGLLLILLMMFITLGFGEIISQFFSSNLDGETYFFEQYFQENVGILAIFSALIFIVFMLLIVFDHTYPVFYMKRLSETGNPNIKTSDILDDLKNNLGRIFLLFLGLTFIITPIALILLGFSFILVFLLIGILILIILFPLMMNIVNFLLFDYFHTKRGFFNSLGYAIRSQFSYLSIGQKTPFWKYWLSITALYFIIQMVVSVLVAIPMFIIIGMSITTPENNGNEHLEVMGIITFVTYSLSILISLIASNIIYINAGLMYYDSRTDLHKQVDFTEIDSIGKNEI